MAEEGYCKYTANATRYNKTNLCSESPIYSLSSLGRQAIDLVVRRIDPSSLSDAFVRLVCARPEVPEIASTGLLRITSVESVKSSLLATRMKGNHLLMCSQEVAVCRELLQKIHPRRELIEMGGVSESVEVALVAS